MKVLIIKYSSFGDVIQTIPLARSVKDKHPYCSITWLVDEKYQDILLGNPYIDEIISFSKKDFVKDVLRGNFSLLRTIKREKFDIVFDPQGLFVSGLLTLFSGAKQRIGFSNAREGAVLAYTKKVKVKELNSVERYLLLLDTKIDGIDFFIPADKNADIDISRKLENRSCKNNKPIILLCPTSRWPTKNWPLDRYIQLSEKLSEFFQNKPIFIGASSENKEEELIKRSLGEDAVAFIGNEALSVKSLIALMRRADLLVTNDSGPMHLASALNLPVVAIFGPTSEKLTGPYTRNTKKRRIIFSDVSCRPCFRKKCPLPDISCMKGIDVKEVFDKCKEILSDTAF